MATHWGSINTAWEMLPQMHLNFIRMIYESVYRGTMLLRSASVQHPSSKQLKYSNCIVNSSKYLDENQKIRFHHYCLARLIHHFDQDQTDGRGADMAATVVWSKPARAPIPEANLIRRKSRSAWASAWAPTLEANPKHAILYSAGRIIQSSIVLAFEHP